MSQNLPRGYKRPEDHCKYCQLDWPREFLPAKKVTGSEAKKLNPPDLLAVNKAAYTMQRKQLGVTEKKGLSLMCSLT